MPSPSMYMQEGGFSQRNQRRNGTIFRDQHDRRYHAVIELKTGHPCGPLEPQFTAPLMPPLNYMRVGMSAERPYDVVIDYARWIADLRSEANEWRARGEKLARLVHGEKYDANAPFTRQVLEELGPPPQHVEPVIAARQGNKYVLGLTDRVDVRLYAMLQEDVATQTTPAEPDFSDVVESLDDEDGDDPVFEAMQTSADAAADARKKKDRDRKALKREQERMAAEAAHAAQNATAA